MSPSIKRAIEVAKEDGIRELTWKSGNLIKRHTVGDAAKVRSIRLRAPDPHNYLVDVGEYELAVDVNDPGISRNLLLNGVKEEVASSAYKEALERLHEATDEPLQVLEVGANIGYYAMMPLVISETAEVYVVEIEPTNFDRFLHNLEHNGVLDRVVADQVGFSDGEGRRKLHIAKKSNWHTIHEGNVAEKPERFERTEVTTVLRGEDWLAEQGIDQQAIDVVRMDVQGAEAEVLRGLPGINPSVMYLELHSKYLDEQEKIYLHDRLRGAKIVTASTSGKDDRLQIETIDEALSEPAVELVLRFG